MKNTLAWTEKRILALPIGEHKDPGTPKLYLRVSKTGRRVFVIRDKVSDYLGGRMNSIVTLGPYPKVSLKEAKLAALSRSAQRLEERVTLGTVLEEHRTSLTAGWRPATRVAYGRYQRVFTAAIGGRPIADLTRQEIVTVVGQYGQQSKVAANRALQYLKTALGWACEAGFINHSPADKVTTRVAGGTESSRSRVLSHTEIQQLFLLDGRHAVLCRALLLSGCRIGELTRAQPGWLQGDVLSLPASVCKNKKSRPVVLSSEVLKMPDGDASHLFASITNNAVQVWLRRIHGRPRKREWEGRAATGFGGGWTPHDLRRTFASISAEVGVPPHLIARLLGHTDKSGSGTLGVYNRHDYIDEMREAVAKVESKVLAIAGVMGPNHG